MESDSRWVEYREIDKRLSKGKIKWRSCGYAFLGLLFGFDGKLDMNANFCEGHRNESVLSGLAESRQL